MKMPGSLERIEAARRFRSCMRLVGKAAHLCLAFAVLCGMLLYLDTPGTRNVAHANSNSILFFTSNFSFGGDGNIYMLPLTDGAEPEVIQSSYTPHEIEVDRDRGYLYYAYQNGTSVRGEIFRMNLDGSDRELIHATDNDRYIYNIALDSERGKLLYTDESTSFINRDVVINELDLTESTVTRFYANPPGSMVFISSLVLDPVSGYFYFSYYDTLKGSVMRGQLDGENIVNVMPEISSGSIELAVDSANGKIYYSMDYNSIGMAELDGSDAEIVNGSFNGIKDIVVDAGAGKVYVADDSGIYEMSLDGTEVSKIVEMQGIRGITVMEAPPTYTIAPIADQTLTELDAGYEAGTQETRSVTIERTGTGTLENVSAALGGANADAFELTPPSADTLDDATPAASITVRAKDGLAAGTYTAEVTVTADRMVPVTFGVTQVVQPSPDAKLSGLALSAGTLHPAFDPGITAYSAAVPFAVESVTVAATPSHDRASTAVFLGADAVPGGTVALDVGDNTLEVEVTAEDGVTTERYTIVVTRAPSGNAAIGTLALEGIALEPAVNAEVFHYSATVSNAVYAAAILATPQDGNATVSSITVNGDPATSPVMLKVGANVIEVEITAQDGESKQTYTVTVMREASANALLGSLAVDRGTLEPSFSPFIYAYVLDVSHETESVSVTADVYHDQARLMRSGDVLPGGTPFQVPLTVGSNVVTLTVEAENGVDAANYTLTIRRAASGNAELSGLMLSDGTLTPGFAADVTDYRAEVPHEVTGVTVTASADHAGAALRVNGSAAASGVPSASLPLAVGDNPIDIEVTAQDGQTTKLYRIMVTRAGPPADAPADDDFESPEEEEEEEESSEEDTAESGLQVTVNGMMQDGLATVVTTTVNGRIVATVSVNASKLAEALESEEDGAVVSISVGQAADEVFVALTGDAVKALENKRSLFVVSTPNGSYALPAAEVEIDRMAERLGQADLAEIVVRVVIARSDADKDERMRLAAEDRGFDVMVSPVDFAVIASNGGNTAEADRFSEFVKRELPLPEGVRPDEVATAVILEQDGALRHVPTYVTEREGKYYAVIHSLTNSTYAVISNPARFADVERHWAEAAVNDLASRLIANGREADRFHPDASVTRAEFAAFAVRALGLSSRGGVPPFADVSSGDWFAGAAATAQAYGLINGYDDGTFRPAQPIHRSEAVAIVARMMEWAGMEVTVSDEDAALLLSGFRDAAETAEWARPAVAVAVKYGVVSGSDGELRLAAAITRAEMAAVIHRMLQRAGLIDNSDGIER